MLDRLPLTRNGKIDYTALARSADGVEAPAQANADTQDPLADIWADVLGTPVTGATDFFAAGGNSLLAAQAVTRTLTAHALPASRFDPLLRQLLTAPTLTAYRAAVHAAPAAPAAAALAHFEEDAQLVLPPRSPDSQRARPTLPLGTRGGEVLLTGATGFLGAFLLDRLVRTTNVTVHCLVRASDEDKALRRIEDAARRYLLPQPPADRLRAVPADLSQPDLGLPPGVAEHLANSVDLVLHNAAHVNFLYPYAQLRNTNVRAVRALVDLAAARRVPLHYVSTTAVFAGSGVGGVPEVDESTPLSHPELLSMGYPESKWVAERMLAQAAAQGLPVTIHRPYEITGDSRTGAWNTTTAICAVVDAVARLGAVPEVPLPLDLVPVDHVASAITRIAMQLPHLGGAVHLTNPRPAMLADMAERMRAAGHTVRTVPYGEWVDMLGEHVRDHPAAPIAPFLPRCSSLPPGARTSRSKRCTSTASSLRSTGPVPTRSGLTGPVPARLWTRRCSTCTWPVSAETGCSSRSRCPRRAPMRKRPPLRGRSPGTESCRSAGARRGGPPRGQPAPPCPGCRRGSTVAALRSAAVTAETPWRSARPGCQAEACREGCSSAARAPVSKTGCRRFDSCHPCHHVLATGRFPGDGACGEGLPCRDTLGAPR